MDGAYFRFHEGWAVIEIKYPKIFLATFLLPIINLLLIFVVEYTEREQSFASAIPILFVPIFLEMILGWVVNGSSTKIPFNITDNEYITYFIIGIAGISVLILNGILPHRTQFGDGWGFLIGMLTIGLGIWYFGISIISKLYHSLNKE